MRLFRFLPILLLCSPALAHAQQAVNATAAKPPSTTTLENPKTPAEFFARARQLSDLEASGIPFHLKATYVASGDAEFTGNGTYEEWWQSKDLWRKEATLENFKYLEFKNGGEQEIYTSAPYIPLRVRQMLNDVLIRIPTDGGTSADWKLQQKTLNGATMILLSHKVPCGFEAILGGKEISSDKNNQATEMCRRQDFFTVTGVMTARMLDTAVTVYDDFRPFHTVLVPRNIVAGNAETSQNLIIAITALEPLGAGKSSSDFAAISQGLQRSTFLARLSADHGRLVQPPHLTRQVDAEWPTSLTSGSFHGPLVVAAIIDTKGKVREAHVIHSAGRLFDNAALKAVRQYKFAPAKYKGDPVAVKMHIVVDFRPIVTSF